MCLRIVSQGADSLLLLKIAGSGTLMKGMKINPRTIITRNWRPWSKMA
jgi:hypothetical protein